MSPSAYDHLGPEEETDFQRKPCLHGSQLTHTCSHVLREARFSRVLLFMGASACFEGEEEQ